MNDASFHIVCVNPWIHDFAAYDFWAKPLGLLQIASLLRRHGIRVTFLDCLDRFHPLEKHGGKVLWDGRGPYRKQEIAPPPGLEDVKKRFSRYGIDPAWFRNDLKKLDRVDAVFVTSFMTYWAGGARETISVIKEMLPGVPVILGGIYPTLCPGHAEKHAGAEQVVIGGGFSKLPEIIRDAAGVDMAFPFTPENPDDLPYPAFDLLTRIPYVPILTSEGCPFSCEYCASSFLAPTFRQRSPSAVFNEIAYWHLTYNVRDFAFYDDALLINSRDHALLLFEEIARSGMDVRLHTPNALHIRELSFEVCDLMYRAGVETVRLGLETADFSLSRTMDGKVNADEFRRAVRNLKRAGFDLSRIGAYLLCGLPGQYLRDVEDSISEVKKTGIQPTLSFYTPIPCTPLWEKAKQYARYALEEDPVFTNNTIFPCVRENNPEREISRLKQMCAF